MGRPQVHWPIFQWLADHSTPFQSAVPSSLMCLWQLQHLYRYHQRSGFLLQQYQHLCEFAYQSRDEVVLCLEQAALL